MTLFYRGFRNPLADKLRGLVGDKCQAVVININGHLRLAVTFKSIHFY